MGVDDGVVQVLPGGPVVAAEGGAHAEKSMHVLGGCWVGGLCLCNAQGSDRQGVCECNLFHVMSK